MGWVFRSNASIRKNYLFRKLLVHTDALYSLHLIAKIDATRERSFDSAKTNHGRRRQSRHSTGTEKYPGVQ